MREKSAPKKRAQLSMIYLTFLLLLSIPLTIFGLTQDDFDLRERAFEDLELSEEHPCLISFPNVNPYSLQVGETVTVQVDAKLEDKAISELRVKDGDENLIHEEIFANSPIEIATSFAYTPLNAGEADLIGELTLTEGGKVNCEITSPYDIQGLQIIPENNAPDFITLPSQSIPSQNIVTNDTYEYTLEAQDPEGDRINYSYSFTPRADWLNKTIIDDGSSGRLTIKFSGRADKPASYLANIFIHDGYSKNLSAQSWVINVSPEENDIPVVTITEPVESLRLDKGTTFKSSWEATDRNFIERYELFITRNITDEEQWIPIDKDIPYDTNSYNVETSDLTTGTYKLVAQAIDNQTPPGIGRDVSSEIVISSTGETPIEEPEKDIDDEVILSEPQVINMSPMSTDQITNKRVTIRATLVAGTDATINEESIMFKLDNVDYSDQIKINRISEEEYTIIYQPQQDLEAGLHKAEVIFADSKESDINKSWDFTIQALETEDDSIYNIFGYEIGKNVVRVIAIGVVTVILAIVAPFIIFSIWKGDKTKDDSTIYANSKLPPSIPTDNTEYTPVEKDFGVKEMVETDPEPVENPEEDLWDKYSAPKPQEEDSNIEEEAKIKVEPLELEQTNEPVNETTEEVEVKVEDAPETSKEQDPTPPPPPPSEIPEQVPTTVPENEATEPIQNETPEEPTAPAKEAEATPPAIPEPEIPEISELQKLSEQLQKIREQEKQENDNNQNPQE
jgi:hypothetical protein